MTFFQSLAQFFKDSSGDFSAMRLVFISWSLGVLVLFIHLCLVGQGFVEVPNQVIEILGLTLTGKVAQSYIEGKNPPVFPPKTE